MFKSLQIRMSFVLILLIVCVMMVIGTFILHGVSSFYTRDFTTQMNTVFTDSFCETLNRQAQSENAYSGVNTLLRAYSAQMGITSYRNYYILDGVTAKFLDGTNPDEGANLTTTHNIVSAMSGTKGSHVSIVSSYMDYAIPVFSADDTVKYVVYIKDTKEQMQNIIWMVFATIVQAMLFGLAIAIGLSFLLSRTITNPIENITRGAKKLSDGDFDYRLEVQSDDEIGTLTKTFNTMAGVIKDTMEETALEKNKLETIFLHMPDGVVAFDSDKKLLHVNNVCRDMFSLPRESDVSFDDIFTANGVEISFDEVKALDSQSTLVRDTKLRDRFLEMIFTRFEAEKQGGVLIIIHDVTQQQKLDASRREFIANVSHELRTPLTNIKSYTETVLESDDLPPTLRNRFLGVVVTEADRMTRLVKDLLIVSRLDNNRMDWNFTRFYPEIVLRSVYEAVLMDAKKHSHSVSLNVKDDLGTICADRDRIEQVIVNIVSNAMKYTPDGGKIDIEAQRENDMLHISVTDNGIGIPKEDLPRLFERFYRVDKARSRERGGTGLGLAIARDIISAHSGTITVDSDLGSGTRVDIIIPATLEGPVTDKQRY